MTVEDDDILEVTARCEANGVEDVVNVFQFRNVTGSSLTDAEAVADIRLYLDDEYDNLTASQADTFVYRDITFRNITQSVLMGTFGWPTLTTGDSALAQIPPGCAGLVNCATNVARVVLKKYFGGWVTATLDNDGSFSSAVTAAILQFGLNLLGGIVGPNGAWEYGYFSPKTMQWEKPVSATATDIPAYQRRRKQGRGV